MGSGTGCSIKISNYLPRVYVILGRALACSLARRRVKGNCREREREERKKERRMGNFSYELDVNLFDRWTANNKSRLIAIPAGGWKAILEPFVRSINRPARAHLPWQIDPASVSSPLRDLFVLRNRPPSPYENINDTPRISLSVHPLVSHSLSLRSSGFYDFIRKKEELTAHWWWPINKRVGRRRGGMEFFFERTKVKRWLTFSFD